MRACRIISVIPIVYSWEAVFLLLTALGLDNQWCMCLLVAQSPGLMDLVLFVLLEGIIVTLGMFAFLVSMTGIEKEWSFPVWCSFLECRTIEMATKGTWLWASEVGTSSESFIESSRILRVTEAVKTLSQHWAAHFEFSQVGRSCVALLSQAANRKDFFSVSAHQFGAISAVLEIKTSFSNLYRHSPRVKLPSSSRSVEIWSPQRLEQFD